MKRSKVAAILLLVLCLFYFSDVVVSATASPPAKVELSLNELEYIQSKKVLKVSLLSDSMPFSYSEKDRGYQGLPVMILNRFSEITGITLEYVPAKDYNQSLDQLKAGDVDCMGMLTNYSHHKKYNYDTSMLKIVPYLTTQVVLIQHKNTDLSELSLITMADIKGRLPLTSDLNVSSIYYANPRECLNAVRCGQSDVTIGDSFTAAALMQEYKAKDLISIPADVMMNFGFGFPPETDSRLLSALQKTIDSFSKADITRSLIQGSDYKSDSFMKFIYRYPFEIICFGFSIMFVIVLVLLTYTKVNVRQHQSLQGYEESYRLLSDTFGEAGMEYDYMNDVLTIFGKNSSLDIDEKVADFKENLQNKSIRISLTTEQFSKIISDGAENKSFSTEFQCGVKSGEWVWYRLIYTVICTTESHRRPIRLVGCLANINEEHAEKDRLLNLSSKDPLTGLLNRKTAEDSIRSLLKEDSHVQDGILFILDIDYFKKFNDQKGHLCGDDVLRSLGQSLGEVLTTEDILCRWGGDEFLFFLTASSHSAQDFSIKLQQLCGKMSAYRYRNSACPVTLSIGGARSYSGCTFDLLFQQADDALYFAKNNGKNQFKLYQPSKEED